MAVLDAYKNFALAKVATAPSPATTGTSLTLVAGQGAYLPTPPFNASAFDGAQFPTPANAEIVRVTARAGDVLTLVRAQESTTARAILVGDYIGAAFTVKFVTDLQDSTNQVAGTLADARLSANVPLLNAANTWTKDQLIEKVRPELVVHYSGVSTKGHLTQTFDEDIYFAHNLSYNGSVWNRDDTGKAGSLLILGVGYCTLFTVPAGANPATLLEVILCDPSRNVQMYGTLGIGGVAGNVPRKDQQNTFASTRVAPQVFEGNPNASVYLRDLSQAANQRQLGLLMGGGSGYIVFADDAFNSISPLVMQFDRVGGHVHVGGDLYEKGRTTPMGHWIDIPYSTSNFTTNQVGSSWFVTSGGQNTYAYTLIGKTLWLNFYFSAVTVTPAGGSIYELRLALPPGFTCAKTTTETNLTLLDNNVGGWVVGFISVAAGNTYIGLRREAAGNVNWSASGGNTYITGRACVPVT